MSMRGTENIFKGAKLTSVQKKSKTIDFNGAKSHNVISM